MHPRDRCTTIAYFDDEDISELERRARDDNGKSILVPADMNYNEWKAKYVTNAEKSDIMLTEREKKVIKDYTGFDATRINKAIRTNSITSDIQDRINILDNAINKAKPLKEDITVYRGGIIQNFKGFENSKKMSHETIMNLRENIITDRAFVSTSKVKPEELGRNIIMKIKLPKSFKGALNIQEYAVDKYKYQDELLLKRNTSFFVNKIDYKDGKYYFDMEVIE